jgi:hypothetical protein
MQTRISTTREGSKSKEQEASLAANKCQSIISADNGLEANPDYRRDAGAAGDHVFSKRGTTLGQPTSLS